MYIAKYTQRLVYDCVQFCTNYFFLCLHKVGCSSPRNNMLYGIEINIIVSKLMKQLSTVCRANRIVILLTD